MPVEPGIISTVWRLDDGLLRRLYARAGAARWQLSVEAFASFLLASARREFGAKTPEAKRVERHCSSLHLEDLALACACAEGIEPAWDEFVRRYRPVLYRAADALDPTGGGRELADSLYAELFGLKAPDGVRQSHLGYFHGRSSLATWLRAVLAQRYVDKRRREMRLAPLPDDEAPALTDSTPLTRPAMQRFVETLRVVLASAVAALPPRDRLRIRCYYAQDLTLAQIGGLLGESEATVSRSLARARRTVREHVERALEDEGLSRAEIRDGFVAVSEDAGPLDLAELLGPGPLRAERLDATGVEACLSGDTERRKQHP